MIAYQPLRRSKLENARRYDRLSSQSLVQQRLQNSPEPGVRRYIESGLGTVDDRVGQFPAQGFFQQILAAGTPQFPALRQSRRKLHDPVIEQRRTDFKRVGHTHPVDLVEDVVRKVI